MNTTPTPKKLALVVGDPRSMAGLARMMEGTALNDRVVVNPRQEETSRVLREIREEFPVDDSEPSVIPTAPKTKEGLRVVLDLDGAPYTLKFDGGNLAVLDKNSRIKAYAGSLPKSVSVEEINQVIGLVNSMASHPSSVKR